MKKVLSGLATSLCILGFSGTGIAASVVMEGDYVKTAVSDDGTLGYGGTTAPGILHDANGTGTFIIDDYLTPGSPWELFAVSTGRGGTQINNNDDSDDISGTLTNIGPGIYDQHVSWTGSYGALYSLTTEVFFNDGDEQINFSTTLTALQDLTDVMFLRSLDPDPDVQTYDNYDTVNGRGYDANNDGDFDDAGDIAPEDWVHSEGTSTGLTIGLFTDSEYVHNTGVSSDWSTDPLFYLGGTDDGNGDYTLGLSFSFGGLLEDDSVTFDYAYIMGENLDDASGNEVPEPATMLLFGTGLVGLLGSRIRKKK